MSAETIARGLDPKAKQRKGRWLVNCPCHEDDSPSLEVVDKNGATLWICRTGCDQADVTAELQKRGLIGKANGAAGAPRTSTKACDDDWRPIMPVPEGSPEPALSHPSHGKPTATWTYRDARGRTLFHVVRFDPPGERKQILPRVWGTLNGRTGWNWRHPATPRPLYGLDRLAACPDAPVVVVEGEKAADAAAKFLPDHVVITWAAGSNATDAADWSPLKGRRVWIWPDNDEPGRKAAEAIGDALLELAESVLMVDVPAVLPEGWDLADPIPDDLDLREIIDQAERHAPAIDRLVERAKDDPGAAFEGEAVDSSPRSAAATRRPTSVPAPGSRSPVSASDSSIRRWSSGGPRLPDRLSRPRGKAAPSVYRRSSLGPSQSTARNSWTRWSPACGASWFSRITPRPESRSGRCTAMRTKPRSTVRGSRSRAP